MIPRLPLATSHRRQRGVVMFVALIVMVAMALAALALIRSVDTTTSVVGNLGFRQASILPANVAVEEVVAAMFEKKLIDLTQDDPSQNYFAAKQADEDARGIPKQLQKKSGFTLARVLKPNGDNEVRYVIERMCQSGGPVAPAGIEWYPLNCDMLKPKLGGTTTAEEAIIANPYPFYRLTVRVDGPRNTASFVQVMLR
jgi:type IV pilus assembly protein PilX